MKHETKITAQQLAMFMGCEVIGPRCAGKICSVGKNFIQIEHENGHIWVVSPPEVKPVLRPVTAITGAELTEFALMCSGADSAVLVDSAISNYIRVMCVFGGSENENLVINERGETWYSSYFDHDERGSRNVVRTHEQTLWLARRGFDIFDWIPAGLAIDATKKQDMKNETAVTNLRQDLLEKIGEWLDSPTVLRIERFSGIERDPEADAELHIKMAEAAISVYIECLTTCNTAK